MGFIVGHETQDIKPENPATIAAAAQDVFDACAERVAFLFRCFLALARCRPRRSSNGRAALPEPHQ